MAEKKRRETHETRKTQVVSCVGCKSFPPDVALRLDFSSGELPTARSPALEQLFCFPPVISFGAGRSPQLTIASKAWAAMRLWVNVQSCWHLVT